MSDFIYSSKKNKGSSEETDNTNRYYCLKDYADFMDKDNNPRINKETSDKEIGRAHV